MRRFIFHVSCQTPLYLYRYRKNLLLLLLWFINYNDLKHASLYSNKPQAVQIKDLYKSENTKDGAANRDAVDDVMGDRSFICPSISLANQLSSTGVKNYQYRLTHRASNEVWPSWMGVIHGADIQVYICTFYVTNGKNGTYFCVTWYV